MMHGFAIFGRTTRTFGGPAPWVGLNALAFGFLTALIFIFTVLNPNQSRAQEPVHQLSFGVLGNGDGQFQQPQGIAVDGSGNIYVADAGAGRIQKFDSSGDFLMQIGNEGDTDGHLSQPHGIAVDGSGNVYVADWGNSRIQKFDATGVFVLKFGVQGNFAGQFLFPADIALDSAGNIYVADAGNNRIQKFDSSGNFLLEFGNRSDGTSLFADPRGVALDGSGNIYVADTFNQRIQKFGPSGNSLFGLGSAGDGDAQFAGPQGIALDSAGNIYVADPADDRADLGDTGNDRIQVFDSSGNFLLKFGAFGTGDGQFKGPVAVAVDGAGKIYVADRANARVQVFGAVALPDPPGSAVPESPGRDLVLSFGAPLGVWTYTNDLAFDKINSADPDKILVADVDGSGIDDIILDLGAQFGLWIKRNNGDWSQYNVNTTTHLAAADLDNNGQVDVLTDFGAGVGTWVRMNDDTWQKFNANTTGGIIRGDTDGNGQTDVIVNLGVNGTWSMMNNTEWVKQNANASTRMLAADLDGNGIDELILDLGPAGVWAKRNNATWERLNANASEGLVAGDIDGDGKQDLIMDMGPGIGLWVRKEDGVWARLNVNSPNAMAIADLDNNGKADLIVDLGAGVGTWAYRNDATWTRINANASRLIAAGTFTELVVDPPLENTLLETAELLTLTGAFDTTLDYVVAFFDDTAYRVEMPAVSVTATTISVRVPPYVDVAAGQLSSGQVSVQPIAVDGALRSEGTLHPNFEIMAPPALVLPSGHVTANFARLLADTATAVQDTLLALETESGGDVNTAALREDFADIAAKMTELDQLVSSLFDDHDGSAVLGQLSDGTDLVMDDDTLIISDQILGSVARHLGNVELTSALLSLRTDDKPFVSKADVETCTTIFIAVGLELFEAVQAKFSVGEILACSANSQNAVDIFAIPVIAAGTFINFVPGAKFTAGAFLSGAVTVGDQNVLTIACLAENDAATCRRDREKRFRDALIGKKIDDIANALAPNVAAPLSFDEMYVRYKRVVGDVITFEGEKDDFDDNAANLIKISLSLDRSAIGEAEGTVNVLRVSLSKPATANGVSVDLRTIAGTATAGTDFVALNQRITLQSGESVQLVPLTILQDEIDEDDETFTVELVALSGSFGTVDSSARTVTITITDDDDSPSLSIAGASVSEGAGSVRLTITLAPASARAVQVSYATASGSAVAGADFTSTSGAVSIPAGATSAMTSAIAILDNSVDAADKSFTVALSAPVNATLGTATATVIITDDDDPTTPPPDSTGVARFDGAYTGDYNGSGSGFISDQVIVLNNITGSVGFSVSDGVITVTAPSSGSGNLDADGIGSFNPGSGVIDIPGANCSFSGTFVVNSSDVASAAGSWTCNIDADPDSGNAFGSWSAAR